jgi:acetoin utilization deacetylase AcuC-like enzyme
MPQFILVSAGFDAHAEDSISNTDLSSDWFAIITHILRKHAADCCDGRLLYILEGGYNPISLEESIFAVIDALLQKNFIRPGILSVPRAEKLLQGHPI